MTAALADPASEQRWLAGEDVLASAAMTYVTPDAATERIAAMARDIGATV